MRVVEAERPIEERSTPSQLVKGRDASVSFMCVFVKECVHTLGVCVLMLVVYVSFFKMYLCVSGLYMCTMCVQWHQSSEESLSPGTGQCGPQSRCREQNPGLLKEQLELSTAEASWRLHLNCWAISPAPCHFLSGRYWENS